MKGLWVVLLAGLVALPALVQASQGAKPIDELVRHELIMLPYFTVFDELSFQVKGDKVTLMGQVTRPTLKSGAERVVQRIAGVAGVFSVTNNLQVKS